MEIGNFEKVIENKEIEQIAASILKEDIKQISRICEQWGENEDEDGWYLEHAEAIAQEICEVQGA